MQAPDPVFEKMVLLDVVEQMKNPEDILRRQLRLKRVIPGPGTTILVVNGLGHIVAVPCWFVQSRRKSRGRMLKSAAGRASGDTSPPVRLCQHRCQAKSVQDPGQICTQESLK